MTALKEFERLESPGIWHPAPDEQRRDVIVSFGDATLVIANGRGDALAHWSLPAIERTNPGEHPALFRPGSDATETLELSDETMIRAIDKVRGIIERRRPRPGRLRLAVLAILFAAIAGLAIFWLPGAMIRYVAAVVPFEKRAEIGESLLTAIQRVSGKPCDTALGERALAQLHKRLLPDTAGRVVVLSAGVQPAEHLPGGIIILNRSLVEDYETPEAVAGFILAEDERSRQLDPLVRLLQNTGIGTSLRLLTTGDISLPTLKNYAEGLLTAPKSTLGNQVLLARFRRAHVPSSPYAYALDMTGETTLELIEADPVSPKESEPVLTDAEWVSLQGICGE